MGGLSELFASQTPQPNCIPISDGSGRLDAWVSNGSGSGSGDVVGPAGATDGSLVLFDGPSGKLIKQDAGSGVVITNGSGVVGHVPFSATPAPNAIPVSNGSGNLDDWVTRSSVDLAEIWLVR